MNCIYSAQKQMGRPRKRQRADEADEPIDFARPQSEQASMLNGPPAVNEILDFGLFAPDLQDVDYTSSSTETGVVTPLQHNVDLTHPPGASQAEMIE